MQSQNTNDQLSIILKNVLEPNQNIRQTAENQLKALYEKEWESIAGNCDQLLYLGGNENSSQKYVSEAYDTFEKTLITKKIYYAIKYPVERWYKFWIKVLLVAIWRRYL